MATWIMPQIFGPRIFETRKADQPGSSCDQWLKSAMLEARDFMFGVAYSGQNCRLGQVIHLQARRRSLHIWGSKLWLNCNLRKGASTWTPKIATTVGHRY